MLRTVGYNILVLLQGIDTALEFHGLHPRKGRPNFEVKYDSCFNCICLGLVEVHRVLGSVVDLSRTSQAPGGK